VTALASPLALWIAALACAAMALRVRRPAAAVSGDGGRAPAIPAPLRLAARLPCPSALVRLAGREGDEARIARAGLTASLTPDALARARAGAGLGAAVAALPLAAVTPLAVVLAPALGLGAAIAPSRWLAARQAARRRAIVRELPDLLDLLGICVESGMALDPAGRSAPRSTRSSTTSRSAPTAPRPTGRWFAERARPSSRRPSAPCSRPRSSARPCRARSRARRRRCGSPAARPRGSAHPAPRRRSSWSWRC
jgi:hypothetical protein